MNAQPWWWIPSIVAANALIAWWLDRLGWWPKPGALWRLLRRRRQQPTIDSLKSGLSPSALNQQRQKLPHLRR